MPRRSLRLALLLFALALAGCKSLYTAPSDFDPKHSNGLGLVTASARLASTCQHGSGIIAELWLRSETTGENHSLVLVNTFWEPDFENPRGSVVAKALPPGNYVVSRVALNRYVLRHPPGWSFKVEDGRVVYLGQIYTLVSLDCKTASFNLTDEWRRDALIVSKLYPKVDAQDVDIRVLRPLVAPPRPSLPGFRGAFSLP